MAWLILFLAGLSEVAWAVGLKYTEGFSKPLASIVTLLFLAVSIALLGWSLRILPLSLAYGVWVGIGTVGTAIASVLLFGEALSVLKLIRLGLIVAGIVGMKLAS
ncbi:QacE family quaternary ammonium compound efflux SMR transporter [Psychromonas sp. MB-3u-54]|uniref:DMT family transporter n=1 Tax=Psychromonas sp. MB-3u-54 TaxID=2058319 RepID=UPI000C3330EF|nr:multidrug efflux SMR transporter [Psychromonas sp. MB-3u-54]PKH02325.1 QacE family quaternary ammonium compound efflux SMR transporter [Psychromonas sp. MB-3u-54]